MTIPIHIPSLISIIPYPHKLVLYLSIVKMTVVYISIFKLSLHIIRTAHLYFISVLVVHEEVFLFQNTVVKSRGVFVIALTYGLVAISSSLNLVWTI